MNRPDGFTLPVAIHAPMSPISQEAIPVGEEWGYQIKWDGVRIISYIHQGNVQLFSRKLLPKNSAYPEVAALLQTVFHHQHDLLLDGEVVIFHPEKMRPIFQFVLQRERMRSNTGITASGMQLQAIYILFDILYENGQDLRMLPYMERHERLLALLPEKLPQLFVADLFRDGQALWNWVQQHEWEGIVSKRLDSPYAEDKKHHSWLKKKTSVSYDVRIVGVLLRENRVASLVMEKDGRYFGNVSLGLDMNMKQAILQFVRQLLAADHQKIPPVHPVPKPPKGERIVWLPHAIPCTVTGQEVTEGGLLRNPKIDDLGKERFM